MIAGSDNEIIMELVSTLDRFLIDTVDNDYLKSRLNKPKSTDDNLWKKICELGFFDLFSGEDLSQDNLKLLLVLIAEISGKVLLPETLAEALLTGPMILNGILSEKEKKIVQSFVAKDVYTNLIEGSMVAAIGWGSFEKKNNCILLNGVRCIPNTKILWAITDQGLYCFSSNSLPQVSEGFLDPLMPRANFSVAANEGVFVSKNVSVLRNLYYLIVAAELSGIAEKVIKFTKAYLDQRKQFGKAVGSFQAVQHKMANIFHKSEEIKALLGYAKIEMTKDGQSGLLARAALAGALVEVPRVVEVAIQMHGGIGFTWEFELHLYLRRAKAYEVFLRPDEDFKDAFIEDCVNLIDV
jgi:hypothetical protein